MTHTHQFILPSCAPRSTFHLIPFLFLHTPVTYWGQYLFSARRSVVTSTLRNFLNSIDYKLFSVLKHPSVIGIIPVSPSFPMDSISLLGSIQETAGTIRSQPISLILLISADYRWLHQVSIEFDLHKNQFPLSASFSLRLEAALPWLAILLSPPW